MSSEGSGLILLTIFWLTSVYVLVLLSRGDLMILLDGIFVGVLTLIWSFLMVECITKVFVENTFNNLLRWIHVNVSGLQSFKDMFY